MAKSKTAEEKEHLSKVADIGCIVCLNNGHGGTPAEIHHIRSGQGLGQRSSHYSVIGLCPPHHRTGGYNVAFHAGKVGFEKNFGSESQLLEQVMDMVNG